MLFSRRQAICAAGAALAAPIAAPYVARAHFQVSPLTNRAYSKRAIELVQKYQLVSRQRAEQSVDFIDDYRSYVINYGLGEDRIRTDIEAAGTSPQARWARMNALLSEPTLPAELRGR